MAFPPHSRIDLGTEQLPEDNENGNILLKPKSNSRNTTTVSSTKGVSGTASEAVAFAPEFQQLTGLTLGSHHDKITKQSISMTKQSRQGSPVYALYYQ